ncbi:MAG: MFS transporter [Burkholderiales bacterium]|nr:MFS transporter [Burkholderiales bacterium]
MTATNSGVPAMPGAASAGRRHSSHIAPGEIAIGVVIGRASENFDFFVYGIASALIFPSIFFPFLSQLEGTLASFAIFSFAFIARPFGTLAFMAIQRRWGREAKLTVALFMLGSSTAGIAFVAPYSTLGMGAILLLAVFRIGQGIALGGSWDGLPSLLALSAPERRRGWYAALGQLGAPVGFAIAAGLFAFLYSSLTPADLFEWGWRYPFYCAFAINVVALFSRLRLLSSPEYAELLDERDLQPSGAGEIVSKQGGVLLIGAFAALASFALFHIVTIFPLSWINLFSHQTISEFLVVQIIGAGLGAVGIVASGLIADRWGRKRTLGALAVLIALFALFAEPLLNGGTSGQDAFILIGFALLGLSYGQSAGVVSARFEPQNRYTGAALTTDLSWLMGAAFAPLVALGLSSYFGTLAVTGYLLSGCIATLVALRVNRTLAARQS